MMDVSTAHSGSLRPSAMAIANAVNAATVTRTPNPSSSLRDRSRAIRRFRNAIIGLVPYPASYEYSELRIAKPPRRLAQMIENHVIAISETTFDIEPAGI